MPGCSNVSFLYICVSIFIYTCVSSIDLLKKFWLLCLWLCIHNQNRRVCLCMCVCASLCIDYRKELFNNNLVNLKLKLEIFIKSGTICLFTVSVKGHQFLGMWKKPAVCIRWWKACTDLLLMKTFCIYSSLICG